MSDRTSTDHMLSIGRFAQLTDLTIRALRFYDEIGLLAPEQVDVATNYRYYAIEQLEPAALIARLRRAELPLHDITAILRERATQTTEAIGIVDQLGMQLGSAGSKPQVDATPMVLKTLRDQPVLLIHSGWHEGDVSNRDLDPEASDGTAVVRPSCDLVADKGHLEEVLAVVQRQGLRPVAPPDSHRSATRARSTSRHQRSCRSSSRTRSGPSSSGRFESDRPVPPITAGPAGVGAAAGCTYTTATPISGSRDGGRHADPGDRGG